jgi:hypothetical protein
MMDARVKRGHDKPLFTRALAADAARAAECRSRGKSADYKIRMMKLQMRVGGLRWSARLNVLGPRSMLGLLNHLKQRHRPPPT